jgi:hypothetical protein
MFARKMK